MSPIIKQRVCAEPGKGLVVFLIGMRINTWWKPWKWIPVLKAMPRMLSELKAQPDLGLLAVRSQFGFRNLMVVQYWKSTQHLHRFAHAPDRSHLPAWRAFNETIGLSGDVGIWHETYVVTDGSAESVYVNMPRHGLGLSAPIFTAEGERATAAKRLKKHGKGD